VFTERHELMSTDWNYQFSLLLSLTAYNKCTYAILT